MSDNNQQERIDRRLRYFDNQFLLAKDFEDEQRYHLDRQRRLVRHMFEPGVVEGLEVTVHSSGQGPSTETGDTVVVSPGTAIDNLGRQIVLTRQVSLAVADPAQQLVVIRYDERTADEEGAGSAQNSRYHELPEVALVGRRALANSSRLYVVLAELEILQGTATIKAGAAARSAVGLRVRGPLSVGGPADFQGGLTVSTGSADLKQGLTVGGELTTLTKGLAVTDGLTTLTKGLTVNGTATLNQGLTVAGALTTLNQGLTVNGTATLNGSVTLGQASNLTVNAPATFSSRVTLGTVGTTLTVSATTTSTNGLTVNELLVAKKSAQLWTATDNGGNNLAAPEIALALARQGVSSQSRVSYVDFKISRYEVPSTSADRSASRTQLDLVFAHGTESNDSIRNVMTMRSNGNVGIGTTTPRSALEVRGDLRIGTDGALFALGSIEIHRLLCGRVVVPEPDNPGRFVVNNLQKAFSQVGTLSGAGYEVTRYSAGIYVINFLPQFSGVPVVVATQEWGIRGDATKVSPQDNCTIVSVTERECIINTGGPNGLVVDRSFNFIAVGPR